MGRITHMKESHTCMSHVTHMHESSQKCPAPTYISRVLPLVWEKKKRDQHLLFPQKKTYKEFVKNLVVWLTNFFLFFSSTRVHMYKFGYFLHQEKRSVLPNIFSFRFFVSYICKMCFLSVKRMKKLITS